MCVFVLKKLFYSKHLTKDKLSTTITKKHFLNIYKKFWISSKYWRNISSALHASWYNLILQPSTMSFFYQVLLSSYMLYFIITLIILSSILCDRDIVHNSLDLIWMNGWLFIPIHIDMYKRTVKRILLHIGIFHTYV